RCPCACPLSLVPCPLLTEPGTRDKGRGTRDEEGPRRCRGGAPRRERPWGRGGRRSASEVRSGCRGPSESAASAPFAPRGLGRGSGAKGAGQVSSRRRSVAGRGVPAAAVLRPILREVRRRCRGGGAKATETIIGRAARPLEKPRYHSPP